MSIIVHHGEVSSAVQKETSHFKMIVSCGHHERRDSHMTEHVDVCAVFEEYRRLAGILTTVEGPVTMEVGSANIGPVGNQ